MKIIGKALLASVAVCLLVVFHARAAEYAPEVGQQGKDVVWVPTALTLVNKMLDMAKLTPKDIHYDLGSGDGRTVITLFLLPELNVKLRPTILDMKPGTRVAANSFDMGDWKPDQTARVDSDCQSWCTAYLWIVPAKVAGAWRLATGELTLTQQYQQVSGTLSQGGKSLAISNGKLDGERISFSAGGTQYSGRVNGDTMEGAAGAAKSAWRASLKKE